MEGLDLQIMTSNVNNWKDLMIFQAGCFSDSITLKLPAKFDFDYSWFGEVGACVLAFWNEL